MLFALAASVSPVRVADPNLRIQIEGKGEIVIQLFAGDAPKAVGRITQLARSGFYDSQRFHRVVRSPKPYLLQIGDPASKTKPMTDHSLGDYNSGTQIPYEDSHHKHVKGAVGLAHRDSKDSGDSQFYITLDSYPFLDGQYTVFGQVIKGQDILDQIELGDRVTKATITP